MNYNDKFNSTLRKWQCSRSKFLHHYHCHRMKTLHEWWNFSSKSKKYTATILNDRFQARPCSKYKWIKQSGLVRSCKVFSAPSSYRLTSDDHNISKERSNSKQNKNYKKRHLKMIPGTFMNITFPWTIHSTSEKSHSKGYISAERDNVKWNVKWQMSFK